MGRIRTIKPEFFQHPDIFDLEAKMIDDLCERCNEDSHLPCMYRGTLRLAYIGLWCQCDREGRFCWNARRLKLNCLPFDDVDFEVILDYLERGGYVKRYTVEGKEYGWVPSFLAHQYVNNRETESKIPHPKLADQDLFADPLDAPDDWRRPANDAAGRKTVELEGRKVFVANENQEPFVADDDGEVIAFATNETDAFWCLPESLHAKWKKAYQGVDVFAEYAKAAAWLESNPSKRKTSRGMSQFLNRWLAKQQDQGGKATTTATSARGSKVREL